MSENDGTNEITCCALCDESFALDHEIYIQEVREFAGGSLDQPPGGYVDEAREELELSGSDPVCPECWANSVHPKARQYAIAAGEMR